MLPILALRHVPCEGPGLIGEVAKARGIEIVVADLPDRFPYWPEPTHYSALLVLGGPMSVYDSQRYPWLKDEAKLLRRCRDEGIPILGICLGSQLLAASFGAKVYAGGRKEIGWGPVRLASAARTDRLLEGTPRDLTVFHWHGDTFDLPAGADLLAGSDLFSHQAFRVEDRWYGFQFHLEVTEEMPEAWAEEYRAELEETGGATVGDGLGDSVERVQALRPHAERIFNNWLDLVERLA
jgi:GMP synthase (glutamine-hydrolysing)